MNNNLIYIVIGLAIAIVVAILLLMRKKKAPEPTRATPPAVNRTAPASVAHTAATQVPTPTAPSYLNRLKTAQQFIDQQRYDDATRELKQGLVTQPNQKELSLKLLNIYAITNNLEGFNGLYESLKAQGDSAILAEANNIKLLLDAEQSSVISKAAEINAKNDYEQGLDFDLSDESPSSKVEETLSFDDLESQLLSDDSLTTQAPVKDSTFNTADTAHEFELGDSHEQPVELDTKSDDAMSLAPTNDGFELSLDELETDSDHELVIDDSSVASTDDLSDFGLTETMPVTTPSDELSLDGHVATEPASDEFHLDEIDANELSNDLSVPDTTPVSESASVDTHSEELSLNEDEFSFDTYGEEETPAIEEATLLDTEHPVETEAAPTSLSADTDFDLNEGLDLDMVDEHAHEAPLEDAATSITLDDDGLDIDELNFDEPSITESSTTETSTQEAHIETPTHLDTTLDSTFDGGLEDTLSQLDALSLGGAAALATTDATTDSASSESTLTEPTISDLAPTESAPVSDSEIDLSTGMEDTVTPSTATDIDDSQFATEFGFINDLDGAQVTLDLASQYMELGEYESAKRLLNEVMEQGNSAQQEQAQALLAKTV
ncbi:MAG: FimV/HubP family polar landmark protein [Psychrobacter sp.]|nr:FimV/HubP family polar landmark protein [Psychrobacter sp.]